MTTRAVLYELRILYLTCLRMTYRGLSYLLQDDVWRAPTCRPRVLLIHLGSVLSNQVNLGQLYLRYTVPVSG